MSKHMTLSERKDIEISLKEGKSFKAIGKMLGKDCTTISKEVRYHLVERKSGAWGQAYNACTLRFGLRNLRYATTRIVGERIVTFAASAIIFAIVSLKKNVRN